MLSSFCSKQNFKVGNIIKVGDVRGENIRLDSTSVLIKTPTSEVVMSAGTLISEKCRED